MLSTPDGNVNFKVCQNMVLAIDRSDAKKRIVFELHESSAYPTPPPPDGRSVLKASYIYDNI
jgi:hypothetical protein